MFVYSFSRRRHLSAVVLTKADGDVTSASFIDKNGGGLSLKTPFRYRKIPPNPQNSLLTKELICGFYSGFINPFRYFGVCFFDGFVRRQVD